jgi:hypothetical protein
MPTSGSPGGAQGASQVPSPQEIQGLVASTPPSGKHRSLGFLAAAVTLGSLLFGYDTGVIAGVRALASGETVAVELIAKPEFYA